MEARAFAYFPLAAATLSAALGFGRERHRTAGNFEVVIDEDPLALDSNVTATTRQAGRMFGMCCREGKLSMGVGSGDPGERLDAGESVAVRIRFDDGLGADFVGSALTEIEVEFSDAGPEIEPAKATARVTIEPPTNKRSRAYALNIDGARSVSRWVQNARGS